MPVGFLIVFSEPGEKVSLTEFHDWYDEEHIPLRLNHFRSFLTGARFRAIDAKKPSWAALYDIDDTEIFQQVRYTRLRANRSAREANLIDRLELLDRRTFELFFDSGETSLSSSLATGDPTQVIVTHGLTYLTESGVCTWENSLHSLPAVNGWIRTRLFKCLDNQKTGTGIVGGGPELQLVPKYIAVHELQDPSDMMNDDFQKVIVGSNVVELRMWQLHRAYSGMKRNIGVAVDFPSTENQ